VETKWRRKAPTSELENSVKTVVKVDALKTERCCEGGCPVSVLYTCNQTRATTAACFT